MLLKTRHQWTYVIFHNRQNKQDIQILEIVENIKEKQNMNVWNALIFL